MKLFSSAWGLLLGPSTDEQIASDLRSLADAAVECAIVLHESRGRDYQGVINLEHRGDRLKDDCLVRIDAAFITRYNKGEARRYVRELDHILNGSRKVVEHLRIWAPFITDLPEEAVTFLEKIIVMTQTGRQLARMLCDRKAAHADARILAKQLEEAEAEADALRVAVEEKLAMEASRGAMDPIALSVRITLFDLLEKITDYANHCGASALLMMDRRG